MDDRMGVDGAEYFERLTDGGQLYVSYLLLVDDRGRLFGKRSTGVWRSAQTWDRDGAVEIRRVTIGLEPVDLVRIDIGNRQLHRMR